MRSQKTKYKEMEWEQTGCGAIGARLGTCLSPLPYKMVIR
jgi:hypothetical protein